VARPWRDLGLYRCTPWFCTSKKQSTGIPVESPFENSFHVVCKGIQRLHPRVTRITTARPSFAWNSPTARPCFAREFTDKTSSPDIANGGGIEDVQSLNHDCTSVFCREFNDCTFSMPSPFERSGEEVLSVNCLFTNAVPIRGKIARLIT